MSIRSTLLPAIIAGIVCAMPALAQTAAPATPQVAPASPQAAPAGAATTTRDAVVERRIAELHTKLKITPAEEKPFGDFATAMRDNAHKMDQAVGQKRAASATATAVEQMESYSALAKAHAEEVSHLVGPFSTLYDTLSPEQKKLADQSFRDFSSRPQAMRGARG